jgi:Metallo-peptidase family M12B Reprolysin-like
MDRKVGAGMRRFFSRLIVGLMMTALSMPIFAADGLVALLAPFSNGSGLIGNIPDGYFEPVALNSKALFAYPPNSKHDLVLPRLGTLAIEHDRTQTVDLGGAVTRWEGHVAGHKALKVTFVKGISGMVSGVIDTPRGRVLLGQAGDYIVYKQSRSSATPSMVAPKEVPEALLENPPDPKSLTESNKPATVSYPVEFNAAALANVPINGEVDVSLPGAGDFRVVHDNTLAGDLGATTFIGYLKDFGDDFRMIVTYSPSGAQGQILTPYGMYLIKTIGPQQWLIDVDGSDLHHVVPVGNDGLGGQDQAPASAIAGEAVQAGVAAAAGATTNAVSNSSAAAAVASNAKTRIDVLVAYTPGLESGYGGVDQVQARIQNLVALANQAYIDSGVDIVLRLVGAVKIDAPDYSSNIDTLNAITDGAGPYKNIAWLRDAYGADLVSLIRPFSMDQGGLCGISWVGGSNGASIALYRNQGFSVVSDGRDGGYFCSAYTFAHELGHNMGNVHDRATVAQQDGDHGAYPYSFGYGIAGQFGTIMSYIDPEVGKFSNPDKLCKGQAACGIPDTDATNSANNALSLNNTRRYVAAYTPEASAAVQMISIAGVVTLDGKALSGVQMNTSAPATCSNTGDNGSFSCIVASDWSGDITPSLAGYSFSPATISLSNLSTNSVDQNFTAAPNKNLSLTAAASPSTSSGGGGAISLETLVITVMISGLRPRRRL